jgi:hypothetical protein
MHYNSDIGGIQNSIDMLRLIQNIEWEPRKMDILEHIEHITSRHCSVPTLPSTARTWRKLNANTHCPG